MHKDDMSKYKEKSSSMKINHVARQGFQYLTKIVMRCFKLESDLNVYAFQNFKLEIKACSMWY